MERRVRGIAEPGARALPREITFPHDFSAETSMQAETLPAAPPAAQGFDDRVFVVMPNAHVFLNDAQLQYVLRERQRIHPDLIGLTWRDGPLTILPEIDAVCVPAKTTRRRERLRARAQILHGGSS